MIVNKFECYDDLIAVLTVLPAAVVLAEVDTRKILYVNPAFTRLSGYSVDSLVNKPQTVLHPEPELGNESFEKHLSLLQNNQELATLPQRLVKHNGECIDIDITANMLQLDSKEIMIGFFNPVTERVQALQELSVRQQELDAIFQNSSVGIMLLKDYRILYKANQRLAEILGYDSPEEMVGISMQALHLDETHFKDFGKRYYETLRHKQNLQIEYQLRKKSGEPIWVVLSGKAVDQMIPADLAKGVIWVLDDITEKKRLELELEKETLKYKNLITFSADAVFILSMETGQVVEFSDMAYQNLGYSPEEMALLSVFDWDEEITPDEYKKMVESIGFQPIYLERYHTRKDGSRYLAAISARKINTDSQKLIHATVRDITQQRAMEETLRKERNLFKGGPTVVFNWDVAAGWPVKSVSDNIEQVMGYSIEDVLSEEFVFSDLIHPADFDKIASEVTNFLSVHAVEFEQTYRLRVASGEYRNFYDYTRVDYDNHGKPISIYGYLIDMTESFKQQKLSQVLLKSTSEGIFGIDSKGNITFANPSVCRMLGFEEEELIGHSSHLILHHSDVNGKRVHCDECNMMQPLVTGKDVHIYDEVLRHKDGSSIPVEYRSTAVIEDGKITGVVVSFHDISAHKEQEKMITRLAYIDSLTELPNRRYFNKKLTEQLSKQPYSHGHLVLIMLDIDHFKDINDSLGHPIGDKLLTEFSIRIKSLLRESDFFARLGGDEFAIILMVNDFDDVTIIAQKILDAMAEFFDIDGHSIFSNVSIGIAQANRDMSADKLISRADIALYKSKLSGRGCFSVYQTGMNSIVREELSTVSQLTHAVERNEFKLAFQPQIDAKSGLVVGLEALIRWQPEGDVYEMHRSPAVFIPLAERKGLISAITQWTVHQLVEHVEELQDIGYTGHVSINLSAELLVSPKTVDNILQPIITHSNGSLQYDIEITETAFSSLQPEILDYLNGLSQCGISLSIDDFGTGYSSLSMLRKLNSSYVKIDKEFIDGVHCNDDDLAIVSATISMAHELGKKVVAEGVEINEQLLCLQELGCDVIQGYYFAKPMFMEELIPFLESNQKQQSLSA